MAEQRARSRAGAGRRTRRRPSSPRAAGFTTEFVGYEKTEALTQIGALEPLEDGRFLAKLRESPFYPKAAARSATPASSSTRRPGRARS